MVLPLEVGSGPLFCLRTCRLSQGKTVEHTGSWLAVGRRPVAGSYFTDLMDAQVGVGRRGVSWPGASLRGPRVDR